jgi:cyclophilin family peptidyl-prolyl cis-trans isomerase
MLPNSSVIQRDNDWKMLESIKPNQRVSFRTAKGTFTVRLHKEDAPFTVLAFFKLVKQKFYNGLTFHRVVPDFVIQGGDPRGDGWGGAGFTIRSEWSLVDFERGSVGMASSGKDTEGCQFFITHVPTPHLDGRYTLFATVMSGMEVVDRIQVGDRILSAELK